MTGSKITSMTSAQMRAARAQGASATDWARVRAALGDDNVASAQNRQIGEGIAQDMARKRGRPVQGEPKVAISLRMPVSVLEQWKATGQGWQTRMVQRLIITP